MHRLVHFTVLFAMVMATAAPVRADETDGDIKKLEGTWEGFAVEGTGERPNQGPVKVRLKISGTKIEAFDLGNEGKDMGTGTFKLDPGKKLKEIDATGVVLPGKREKAYPGIYEVDGDTLRWCVDNRAKERPAEFRTHAGKYLLILKRQK